MERFRGDASNDRLRAALTCTACGHRGALLQLPSWIDTKRGSEPLPVDRIPIALRRQMAKDALRSIGVEV